MPFQERPRTVAIIIVIITITSKTDYNTAYWFIHEAATCASTTSAKSQRSAYWELPGLVPLDLQLVTSCKQMFSFTLRPTVPSGEIISPCLCQTQLKIKSWGGGVEGTRIYAGGHTQPPRKLAESAIHALCKYLTPINV